MNRKGSLSLDEPGDAYKMAENAGAARMLADGIRDSMGTAGQRLTAARESSNPEEMMLMEQVVGHRNLLDALTRVESNKGAPGIDGLEVKDLRMYLGVHWQRIRAELLAGEYKPMAVRRVDIPKYGGGTRMLGIPTALDRFIQQAVLQVLTPIFDPTFCGSSYGFRPGRSAHQAVTAARCHVEAGYRWVVDMDLEKFFDRVNHDVLMSRVARRVADKRVLKLVRAFLEAAIMYEGVVQAHRRGHRKGGRSARFCLTSFLTIWTRSLREEVTGSAGMPTTATFM